MNLEFIPCATIGGEGFMEHIEKSIDVQAPLSTVYNQWTQFEEFPKFMEGVQEVRQLDNKRLHWRAKIGGKEKEWDSEIFEQTPDERIAWRSTSGAMNSGQVSFQSLGPNQTRVNLKINYDPTGVMENIADALGVVSVRVEGDLKRFKQFVEDRHSETGSWRGEIHGREVQPDRREGALAGNSNAPRSQRLRESAAAPVANQNASGKMG
jgi:uncharacterized membrane protein